MRTNNNWDKHEVHVIQNEHITIHHFKRPDTYVRSIKFINTCGVLVVTGDYGNWVFCRGFVPSADNYVSDEYWLGKLKMSSEQNGKEFSGELTEKHIKEGLEKYLEEYGYEGEELKEMKEYYTELLAYTDSRGDEYKHFAYANLPKWADYDCVPYVEDTKPGLKATFDAFDEICRRMKEETIINEENQSTL